MLFNIGDRARIMDGGEYHKKIGKIIDKLTAFPDDIVVLSLTIQGKKIEYTTTINFLYTV